MIDRFIYVYLIKHCQQKQHVFLLLSEGESLFFRLSLEGNKVES